MRPLQRQYIPYDCFIKPILELRNEEKRKVNILREVKRSLFNSTNVI